MRLGILGGTFDPVHYGHLLMAESARETCRLDEVWFLPASDPPHKDNSGITSGKQRAEMLEFAIAGYPEFVVNRMEFDREGKSYTVETLAELRNKRADDELFFIIGGDSLRDLPTWREPQRILELAQIIAINRGREELTPLDQLSDSIGTAATSRIEAIAMPAIDLSSTNIRERVRNQRSIRFQLPRAVEAYIDENKLYAEP